MLKVKILCPAVTQFADEEFFSKNLLSHEDNCQLKNNKIKKIGHHARLGENNDLLRTVPTNTEVFLLGL